MQYYITGALIAFCVLGTLYLSNVHTQYLARLSECVAIEATVNNFPGNPYGPEAWQVFAPICK